MFIEHILLVSLIVKKLLEHFTNKNFKKQIKKNLNEKVMIIHLIAGLIKKT